MKSSSGKFRISFEDISIAESNIKSRKLRDDILDLNSDIDVLIEKDVSNQDAGGTLLLILGTPAVIALSKGIANYLNRDRAKITIEKDGKIIAKNITGDDAARIAEALGNKL